MWTAASGQTDTISSRVSMPRLVGTGTHACTGVGAGIGEGWRRAVGGSGLMLISAGVRAGFRHAGRRLIDQRSEIREAVVGFVCLLARFRAGLGGAACSAVDTFLRSEAAGVAAVWGLRSDDDGSVRANVFDLVDAVLQAGAFPRRGRLRKGGAKCMRMGGGMGAHLHSTLPALRGRPTLRLARRST